MTMENLIIRNETESDFEEVEICTREAFWNIYSPGCDEHYLVHLLRSHSDFVPELDFVAQKDGRIIGNVIYSRSRLVDTDGNVKQILTFGPISVHPDFQRMGVGKAMLEVSFKKAAEMGFDTIVIFGNPGNYVARGFVSCKKHNICLENDIFPTAMLVKTLTPDALDGRKWVFYECEAFNIDGKKAEEYDKRFAPKEKKYVPSQEEFYIYSHSRVY